MSKNKNYHNYKNYSNNKPNPETETVEETVTPKNPAEPTTPQPESQTTGIVSGCPRLRVREAASTNAEVLCEIPTDSKVTIDVSTSTKDFYKVTTSAGVEGFCMKKFIEVK